MGGPVTSYRYPKLVRSQLEDIVEKLGGEDQARRFLSGGLVISDVPTWRDEGEFVSLTLCSRGRTGPEWTQWFGDYDIDVDQEAEDILMSAEFQSTNGVIYHVRILKGSTYDDGERTNSIICADAHGRQFSAPPPELACLIRSTFSCTHVQRMGFDEIIVMHQQIEHENHLYRFAVPHGALALTTEPEDEADEDEEEYEYEEDTGLAFILKTP